MEEEGEEDRGGNNNEVRREEKRHKDRHSAERDRASSERDRISSERDRKSSEKERERDRSERGSLDQDLRRVAELRQSMEREARPNSSRQTADKQQHYPDSTGSESSVGSKGHSKSSHSREIISSNNTAMRQSPGPSGFSTTQDDGATGGANNFFVSFDEGPRRSKPKLGQLYYYHHKEIYNVPYRIAQSVEFVV